jgi:hypothetical protein
MMELLVKVMLAVVLLVGGYVSICAMSGLVWLLVEEHCVVSCTDV